MYTLYYSPGACSMAVHVVLNETGADFKLVKTSIKDGDTRKPEFLKISPQGVVPVLMKDGQAILEGAAQIAFLCDEHKTGLLPASGMERARALQWLMFCNSTLHTAYSRAAWAAFKADIKDEASRGALTAQACDAVQALWDRVEKHLSESGQAYLAGAQPTAGDILMAVIANWSFLPREFKIGPKTKALIKQIIARPSYQKALQTEQVEYKAAA